MMVFMTTIFGLSIVSLQELSRSFFSFEFPWTFGVHLLHRRNFLIREVGQTTDKVDKVPSLSILRIARFFSKPGHSREPDTVLNNVVKFAIAELLSSRFGHIRRLWV